MHGGIMSQDGGGLRLEASVLHNIPSCFMSSVKPRVVVVGSLNLDYIARVQRLPMAGETVAAEGLIRRFGGKGANQAVAASRQGARVSMLGCVGKDGEGNLYIKRLRAEGIDASGIVRTKQSPTGTALIAVDGSGENIIVVEQGANGQLKPGSVRRFQNSILSADALLLQLEVPLDSVIEAVRIANRAEVPVIFNPSPWRTGFPWGSFIIDTLIVNVIEAEAIFGKRWEGQRKGLAFWRRVMATRAITNLIITRGKHSTVYLNSSGYGEVPAFPVKPVDTVGAGDVFAGTFAARRAQGIDIAKAIEQANCAGALATLKQGAQEASPSMSETNQALRTFAHQRASGIATRRAP
jgi:ribokinase